MTGKRSISHNLVVTAPAPAPDAEPAAVAEPASGDPFRTDVADVRLYELTGELRELYLVLEENGGELTPELEAVLERVDGDFRDKVDRVLKVERQKRADAKVRAAMLAAYEEETDRLRALVKADEAAAKSLRGYVLRQLKALGLAILETARFRVRVRSATQPSIRWVADAQALPERFRKDPELDYHSALAALKKDGRLPDGFQVEYTEWLDVR